MTISIIFVSYKTRIHATHWFMCVCFGGTKSNLSFQWIFRAYFCNTTHDAIIALDATTLQWRYNGRDCVSNHQPQDCLLNRLFGRRSKKTSKFRVTGLCARNSPGTGEFPAQMASNAENVSIWWRHHVYNHNNLVTTLSTTSSHTKAETKWAPFCKRYLQMHFLEWKSINFD